MSVRVIAPGQHWRHRASGQLNLILHLGEVEQIELFSHGSNRPPTIRASWLPSVTYLIVGLDGQKTRLLSRFVEQCELVEEAP